jgi:hypothetical protein
MNAGNTSLSRAQLEGLTLIAGFLAKPALTDEQRKILRQWRRECVSTDVMIQVMNRRFREAAGLFWPMVWRDGLLPLTLFRLGLLAIGRRIRTRYRLYQAEHGA